VAEKAENQPEQGQRESEKAGKIDSSPGPKKDPPREIGGRKGPDPTRYGDWEKGGRCIDF
jgi:hypothetical protein